MLKTTYIYDKVEHKDYPIFLITFRYDPIFLLTFEYEILKI